jgi:antitoxin FitA
MLISLIAVAQLIVRNLDEDLVQRLKRRAAANRRSTEEEHRQLLRQVLRPEGLAEALLAMPNVGDDVDFERRDDLPRELDLR